MASETLNTLKQAFRQAAKNAATFFEREPHTLRSATSENDFGMFRYLSRNITPEEAACALPYVANQNRLEMAQFLIEEKAAILSPSYARYALWEAVCAKNTEMADYLKEKSPNIELYYSIFYGETDETIYPTPDATDHLSDPFLDHLSNPLIWAARGGNLAFMENNKHLPLSSDEAQNLFMEACEGNHVPIMKFLIQNHKIEINPTRQNLSPVASAAYSGNMEAVKFLCEDCNADIMAGYIDAIKMTTYFKHKNVEDYLKKRQGSSSIQPSKPHIKPN